MSSSARTVATSLAEAQEIILLEIRNMLLPPLDDLLVIARKVTAPEMFTALEHPAQGNLRHRPDSPSPPLPVALAFPFLFSRGQMTDDR
jgi:hypothetical protein